MMQGCKYILFDLIPDIQNDLNKPSSPKTDRNSYGHNIQGDISNIEPVADFVNTDINSTKKDIDAAAISKLLQVRY